MKTTFFTHETGFQQTLPYSYVTLLSAPLARARGAVPEQEPLLAEARG